MVDEWAEVAPIPPHHRRDVVLERRVRRTLVRRQQQVVDPVARDEQPHRVPALLAGQLRAPVRIGDGSREHGLDGRREVVDPLQEERPLLGVVEGEALVDVELRHVGLDLREVGVDRAVHRHARGHAPARREPGVGLHVAPGQPGVGGRREFVGAAEGPRRIELEVPPLRQPLEAGDLVLLAEEAPQVAIAPLRRDAVAHVARVRPERLEAPRLRPLAGREPQLLQRQRRFDDVAVGGDAGDGVPDHVPREVLDAVLLAEDRVGLDAQRVDAELERAPLVVERVDHHPDVVVLDERVRVVAVHEMGADLGRPRVVRAERDVEVLRVVGDEALGLDRRRHVVARHPLDRQRHDGGLLPGVFVEDAVHLDGRRRPRDRVGDLAGGRRGARRRRG